MDQLENIVCGGGSVESSPILRAVEKATAEFGYLQEIAPGKSLAWLCEYLRLRLLRPCRIRALLMFKNFREYRLAIDF